jgi:hypothetical protein
MKPTMFWRVSAESKAEPVAPAAGDVAAHTQLEGCEAERKAEGFEPGLHS